MKRVNFILNLATAVIFVTALQTVVKKEQDYLIVFNQNDAMLYCITLAMMKANVRLSDLIPVSHC